MSVKKVSSHDATISIVPRVTFGMLSRTRVGATGERVVRLWGDFD